jgi:FkbM family methyltransferase
MPLNYVTLLRSCWRGLPDQLRRPTLRLLSWQEYSTARAARRFAKCARSRFRDEVVISPNGEMWFRDSGGGEFFVPSDRTDWIGHGVSQTEPLESALLSMNMGPGAMLDIGANVGIHSIRVGLKRPDARIFAFEPVSVNHAVLMKNISRNNLGQRVCAIHAAVGAVQGTVTMPASFGTGNWVGGVIRGVQCEKIPLLTIDSFLKERGIVEVGLVKCDVEGYELQVLQGMTACLQNLRPRLLLEVDETWCARLGHHAADVFTLLHQISYKYMRVTPGVGLEKPLASVSASLASTSNFWFYPEETGLGQVGATE